MNADERARAARLRRAIGYLSGDYCPDCHMAGPGRICQRHINIGRRNIAAIRRRHGWDQPKHTAEDDDQPLSAAL